MTPLVCLGVHAKHGGALHVHRQSGHCHDMGKLVKQWAWKIASAVLWSHCNSTA